jgi:hypothetical protein
MRNTINIFKTLPVLRGFSRNVKQDSVASNASGGVAIKAILRLRCICGNLVILDKYFQNVAMATYFSSGTCYNTKMRRILTRRFCKAKEEKK